MITRRRWSRLAALATSTLVSTALLASGPLPGPALAASRAMPVLTGRALLPAASAGEAVPSGAALSSGINGVRTPFAAQPVQGFSAVLPQADGSALVLADNGYGDRGNSADFLLHVYRVAPSYGQGRVAVTGGFGLQDPAGKIPWRLTRSDRRLTGADLDPEGFRQLPDGTFWISDEFGPYLLHTSATGDVLEAPVPVPGVVSPDDPAGRTSVTLASSKGLEGLALSPDGTTLRAVLEGTVSGDPGGTLRLSSFDVASRAWAPGWLRYRLQDPGDSVRDLTAVDAHRLLVLEGDQRSGDAARRKGVWLVDDRDVDSSGYLRKTLLVDLLRIADPQRLGGGTSTFRFPFWTVEDVGLLTDDTLLVAQDNNYPFSSTRVAGRPDDTEMITVRLPKALGADPRSLARRATRS